MNKVVAYRTGKKGYRAMNATQEKNTATPHEELVTLSGEIVAAYVSANTIGIENVPTLIQSVYTALATLNTTAAPAVAVDEARRPAVPIRRSVTDDAVICLECGSTQKMLKRHLRARHGMSPSDYRGRWNLPYDYPLIAPNYSATRSRLAAESGLGRAPVEPAPKSGRKPGRPKKSA